MIAEHPTTIESKCEKSSGQPVERKPADQLTREEQERAWQLEAKRRALFNPCGLP